MQTAISKKIQIYALIVLLAIHRFAHSAVPLPIHWAVCPQNCTCAEQTIVTCLNVDQPDMVFSHLNKRQSTLLNLSFTESGISDLTNFPSMERLIFLNLSNNHISVFNTQQNIKFPAVRQLILRHNHFANGSPGQKHLEIAALGMLSCFNNNRRTAPNALMMLCKQVLERDAFIMFPAVEILDLKYNFISQVDCEAFRLFRLKQLVIAYNNLTSINEHMLRFTPNLQYLDLSNNNLRFIRSSSFFFAQKLKEINLQHNKIKTFNYDSFSPLYQLETLDLSYNDLEAIPGVDLRQLVALRTLRMGANYFKRIARSELIHPVLRELDLSYSFELRVVEEFAFSNIPNLHTINLNNSRLLTYVSPQAFINSTMLHSVDLSYCALEVLPDELSRVSRGFFDHNPLHCECIAKSVIEHITRFRLQQATCSTAYGAIKSVSVLATQPLEECHPEPLLPFGDSLEATVGDQFSIYCAVRQSSDKLMWRFPNGTTTLARDHILKNSVPKKYLADVHSMFTDLYYRRSLRQYNNNGQIVSFSVQPRVRTSREQICLNVVLAEDEGEYRCTVQRAYHSFQRTIRLTVREPAITLYALEVGSHYITLAWNDSLRIHAKERVQFFVAVRDEHGVASRTVQLSLHNPWHSYNIMRLNAGQNYTFCLCYALISDVEEITPAKMIYETCLQQQTAPNLSFIESLSLSSLVIVTATVLLFFSLTLLRELFARFHIWQQQKHRSRVNQSISGQSFLSSVSNGTASAAISYKNQLQLSVSQTSGLNQYSVASASHTFASNAVPLSRHADSRVLAEDLAL